MRRILFVIVLIIPLTAHAQQKPARQAVVKIQNTSLTRDQEIQLGKQFAAQVEREMEVVHNPEIEHWLNQIGQSLAQTPQANAYPYYFKLVNEDSINAFALPGGPMYVHTGLLKAASSEGEVAGVLAHEMSHVALRHSAAQISKQQTYGTLFGVIGAVAGAASGPLGRLTQMGVGLGENSVLMKFSRGYEHDADLNGARMMAAAGYDPMQLPQFFEKLQSEMGTAGEPKGLSLWLADHPATGSRIQYVSQDIQFYPRRDYTTNTGEFDRVKKLIVSIPPPKLQPGKLLAAKQGAAPRADLPPGFKDYSANGFSVGYPDAWQAGQAIPAGSLYMIPRGGLAEDKNGGAELLRGVMIDYYVPQAGASGVSLDTTTKQFLDNLQKGDPNLQVTERSERVDVGGKPALRTKFTTKTSLQQEPDQVVYLYTVARAEGLWYMAQAVQPSILSQAEPVFKEQIGTVKFPD